MLKNGPGALPRMQRQTGRSVQKSCRPSLAGDLYTESFEALEPVRWAVHGGPGTGKSYVLTRIRTELFEDILGWKQGDEFQVVTLQAVMANDLNGDTIHHAFGLNWQGLGDERR